jgi:hypothetical protein
MGASVHLFYDYVFIAAEKIQDALLNRPSGNFSDLYPAWLGTRELLVDHRDPYSSEVTADIQKGVWGRTVDARNPGDPKDESRFTYPLYVVFVLAPATVVSFPTAKVLFLGLAVTTSVLSVFFWFRLFGDGSSVLHIIMGIVLFLGSWPFVLALRVHQPALIVFALMSGAIGATVAELPWMGGVLLALTTIKPQSAVAIVGWLLLWGLSCWRDRKGLVLSFSFTLSAMLLGAQLLLPGWVSEWRDAMSAYMRYAPLTGSSVDLMFGDRLGKAVALIVIVAIFSFCWKARKDAPHTDRFKLACALVLSGNLFTTPVWHAYDHIFLLPPFLLLWQWREQFYHLQPVKRLILRFSALVLLWQWLAIGVGLVTVTIVPRLTLNARLLPYFPILLFPPLVLTSLVLIGHAQLSHAVPDTYPHPTSVAAES